MTQKLRSESSVNKMAVQCGLSVRVSWLSCLLISSITCLPAPKGFGSNNAGPAPSGLWRSSSGSSYPTDGVSDPESGMKLGSVGWDDGSSSGPQATGSFSSGYVPLVGSGYGNSGYSNVGVGSVGTGLYDSNSGSTDGDRRYTEFSSEGDVEESPEPVFSDVSDLEPVYSYRSRSSYQHGRATFAQTRYSPGEVFFPLAPDVQNSPEQPVKVSSKGGF